MDLSIHLRNIFNLRLKKLKTAHNPFYLHWKIKKSVVFIIKLQTVVYVLKTYEISQSDESVSTIHHFHQKTSNQAKHVFFFIKSH